MSELEKCLNALVEGEKLSKSSRADIIKEYEAHRQDLIDGGMTKTDADYKASQDLVAAATDYSPYADLIHMTNSSRFITEADEYHAKYQVEFDKRKKPTQIAMKAFGHGPDSKRFLRDTMQLAEDRGFTRQRIYSNHLNKQLEGKMDMQQLGELIGDPARMREVIRVLQGGASSDGLATQYAKAYRNTLDLAFKDFRHNGGRMGDIENYVFQAHDANLIAKSSFEEWRSFTMDLLDRELMVDSKGVRLNDAALEERMRFSYDDIIGSGSEYAYKQHFEGGKAGPKHWELANSRSAARVLHFKQDGDSLLAYNGKFGLGDEGIADGLMGTWTKFAHDIAIMETLSPFSNKFFNAMHARASKIDKTSDSKMSLTRGMYNTLIGSGQQSRTSGLYNGIMLSQNLLRSGMLGSATLSSLPDAAFAPFIAHLNGLPAFKASSDHVARMISQGDSIAAVQSVQLIDKLSHDLATALRFGGEAADVQHGGRKLADMTMKFSGLTHITTALADSMSLALAGETANLVARGTKWADLDSKFKQAAGKFRITQEDWDHVLAKGPDSIVKNGDAHYLDFLNMSAGGVDRQIANKFGDWDSNLRHTVTNSPNLRLRTASTAGGREQGDYVRALTSSLFLFKSFPTAVVMNMMLPALNMASKGELAAPMMLFAATTALGAMALEAKRLVAGKESILGNMDENTEGKEMGKFALLSFIQGGSGGILADMFFKDRQSAANIFSDLAGPQLGSAADVLHSLNDNLNEAVFGDGDTDFLRDMGKVVDRHVPFHTMWYGRMAYERMINDSMLMLTYPDDFKDMMRRKEQYQKTTFGSGYYDGAAPGSFFGMGN